MRLQIATCAGIALILSGCTNFTSPARSSKLEVDTPYWFDYDASRRGAFLVPDDKKIKICAEPPPDVALSLVSKLETTIKKDEVGEATGKAEFNASVVKLAERTQMVMLLRESLYRLCEQSLRHDFTNEQILKAYEDTVKAAADLAKADVETAKADLAKAEADKAKSQTLKTLVEQGKSATEIQQLLHQ
ncbi:hypothetical protein [Pseudomonas aeruginosa]|uniref:hypothetical protein n=1 Tax=Pseudomonas aeruginosa TaxID=287 RepID=UPI001FF5B8B2|nr:hypothetical protein [Pseudomonas aeruginosa]MCK1183724.1 hypothetical protein [Pseudomonas aeruginosa]HBN9511489.1 hypothetical protein [Pseudomonas aeruginosa]HBN9782224.1 hypothetical protein [Pseudomonas aeruginosa]HBN9851875.1 hypothetical protein [Pseudomonas aeruginosa]HBN9865283.1 hypothetical protein [Pseudomonas aeruginosa]